MDYKELIRRKNKSLAIILLISIVLRAIANAFFASGIMVIAFVALGLVLSGILLFLNSKVNPIVMMYLITLLMTFLGVVIMFGFPCTTNYLMFYMAIFFVVMYEDIRPIVLQCVLSATCMIFFYFKYADKLAETWSPDAMVMCVVYIVSGMLVYVVLCRFTKSQLKAVQESAEEYEEQKAVAESLLGEIGKSVNSLGETSNTISESITITEEISGQIANATDDVARRTSEEVEATENIKNMVERSVEQIAEMSQSSSMMVQASNENGSKVDEGGRLVHDLSQQMEQLNSRMNQISEAMNELNEENKKIITILGTLDSITEQTNLLSLNASIEAARAGEHGKGFAVVATEIRALSENSAQFTDEIHMILEGIERKTELVLSEVNAGQSAVRDCAENASAVDTTFQVISENTDSVLVQAKDIQVKADELENLLNATMNDVVAVSDNIESTSAAMEEISASIANLNGNINNVVDGYNNINGITGTLLEASKSA